MGLRFHLGQEAQKDRVQGLELLGFDPGDHLFALVADVEDGEAFPHDKLLVLGGSVAVESEELGDAVFWEIHPALLDVTDGRGGDADLGARSAHGDSAGPTHPAEDDRFAGDPLLVTTGGLIFHDVPSCFRVLNHEDERSWSVSCARSAVVAD
jgi:hypothetical protein